MIALAAEGGNATCGIGNILVKYVMPACAGMT